MRVTVEVFGIVRDLVGGPTVELELPEPGTAGQALLALAARHPRLVGPVLEPDGAAPNPHYLLNLEGRRFLQDLEEPLPEGSHLLLLAAPAGG